MNQTYTPGWNDPPPLNIGNATATAAAANNHFSAQRKRRPLDPSIQQDFTGGGFGAQSHSQQQSHNQNHPTGQNYPATAEHFQRTHSNPVISSSATGILNTPGHNTQHSNTIHSHHQSFVSHQSQTPPQNVHSQYSTMSTINHPSQLSTHPASAFTPTVANSGGLVIQDNPVKNMHDMGGATQQHAIINQEMMTPIPSSNFTQTAASIQSNSGNHPAVTTAQSIPPESITNINSGQIYAPIPQSAPLSYQQPVQQMMPPTFEDPSSLIFSPPNVVNYASPTRPATQPDPNTYIPPMKAAGDVSLNGPQLVSFLIKATIRLQQGTMREGIQLNLAQLNDLVLARELSDPCLKKLNFVVDALDRGAYDEAQIFFDQMQSNFPNETTGTKWSQGVKFLIMELKKQKCNQPVMDNHMHSAARIGSAGTR